MDFGPFPIHRSADIASAKVRELSLHKEQCERGWNERGFRTEYVLDRKDSSSLPPYRDNSVHAVLVLDSDRKVIRYVEKRGHEHLEGASLAAMNEFGVLQEVVYLPFRRVPETYVCFYFPLDVPGVDLNTEAELLIRITCRRRGGFENGEFKIEKKPVLLQPQGEEDPALTFRCGDDYGATVLLVRGSLAMVKIPIHKTFSEFPMDGIRGNEVYLLRFEVGMKICNPENRTVSFVRHFVTSLSVMNDTGRREMEGIANFKYPKLPLDVAATKAGGIVASHVRLDFFMHGIKVLGGGREREEKVEGHIDALPQQQARNLLNVREFGGILVDSVDAIRERVFADCRSEFSPSGGPSPVFGLVDSVDDIRERVFRCQKIATAHDPDASLHSHRVASKLQANVKSLVGRVRGLRDSLHAVYPCNRTKDMGLELNLLNAQLNALQPGKATVMEEEDSGLKVVVVPEIVRVKVACRKQDDREVTGDQLLCAARLSAVLVQGFLLSGPG